MSGYDRYIERIGEISSTGKDPVDNKSSLTGTFAASALKGAVLTALDPTGIISGYLYEKGASALRQREENNFHTKGVQELAKRGAPGFEYQEREIGGQSVAIAVDATPLLTEESAAPRIWTNGDSENPDIRNITSAMGNKASADILGFKHEADAKANDYQENLKANTDYTNEWIKNERKPDRAAPRALDEFQPNADQKMSGLMQETIQTLKEEKAAQQQGLAQENSQEGPNRTPSPSP